MGLHLKGVAGPRLAQIVVPVRSRLAKLSRLVEMRSRLFKGAENEGLLLLSLAHDLAGPGRAFFTMAICDVALNRSFSQNLAH